MADSKFDSAKAHQHFSSACFNAAWTLLDKPNRTPADDEQLIGLAHASVWHWTQRPDCTPGNLSIGYWQVSRVYAVLKQPANARRYGQLCLEITPRTDAFLLGYAYESLARAEALAGIAPLAKQHLADARKQAEAVTDTENKQYLLKDLDALAAL